MSDLKNESDVTTFTTSKGVKIRILGLSPLIIQRLENQYGEDHPKPQPPTYEVETVGGGKETHTHDDSTAETPQEKAALAKYHRGLAEWEKGLEALTLRVMALSGIDFDIPDTDEWKKLPLAIGLKIPTDPMELKLFYFETAAIGNVSDIVAVMGLVMGLDKVGGNTDQETVMSMFRTTVSG